MVRETHFRHLQFCQGGLGLIGRPACGAAHATLISPCAMPPPPAAVGLCRPVPVSPSVAAL